MTNDTETIDLLLQLFEGLDLLTEQLELFESAFGDEQISAQEARMPARRRGRGYRPVRTIRAATSGCAWPGAGCD